MRNFGAGVIHVCKSTEALCSRIFGSWFWFLVFGSWFLDIRLETSGYKLQTTGRRIYFEVLCIAVVFGALQAAARSSAAILLAGLFIKCQGGLNKLFQWWGFGR